jgi:hypothetical protein
MVFHNRGPHRPQSVITTTFISSGMVRATRCSNSVSSGIQGFFGYSAASI